MIPDAGDLLKRPGEKSAPGRNGQNRLSRIMKGFRGFLEIISKLFLRSPKLIHFTMNAYKTCL